MNIGEETSQHLVDQEIQTLRDALKEIVKEAEEEPIISNALFCAIKSARKLLESNDA